jgi:hypothetical protein
MPCPLDLHKSLGLVGAQVSLEIAAILLNAWMFSPSDLCVGFWEASKYPARDSNGSQLG